MPLDQPTLHSAAQQVGSDLRMTIGEHLEDLRKRLIYAIIGIVIALLATLYFGYEIIAWIAQPILQAMDAVGFPPQTYTRDPMAGFTNVYLKVTLIAAIIVVSPWVIYQIWLFVVEGLYEHERKAVHILAPFSAIMTVLAVLFTYYILLPVCLVFFLSFAANYPPIELGERGFMIDLMLPRKVEQLPPEAGDAGPLTLPVLTEDPPDPTPGMVWINGKEGHIKAYFGGKKHALMAAQDRMLSPLPDLGEYVKFAAFLGLGIVVAFQTPVVMLVIGWTGLIDPAQVAKIRKYAFFASFAIGAVLTPTDVFSMFVLAAPLYLLFEFGLLLMKIMDRRRPMPEDL